MRFPCRFFAICFFLKFKAASCCDAEDELCFFFLNDDDCGIYIYILNDDDFGGNGDDFFFNFFFNFFFLSSSLRKEKLQRGGQIVVFDELFFEFLDEFLGKSVLLENGDRNLQSLRRSPGILPQQSS